MKKLMSAGSSNRAATVRERAITCNWDRMINVQNARLLARAALFALAGESELLTHE
jgi:hypothetical protein